MAQSLRRARVMEEGLKRRLMLGSVLWGALLLERAFSMSPYTAWAISIPLLVWCGAPFHQGFLRALRERKAGSDMLISLSAWAAFLYSVPAVFAADLLPPGAREPRLAAMGALIVLSLLGRLIEGRSRKNTGLALDKLQRRIPATARVLRAGAEENLPLGEVEVGDLISVRPGEQVPLDGEVAEGFSHVEESVWTGTDVPVEKSLGSRVLGGSINKTGKLALRVTHDRSTMALVRIIHAVREGISSKRPGLRLADNMAGAFVPAAVCTAVAAALLWSWSGPRPPQSYSFAALLLALSAAAPWAVALAAPLSLLAGMRRAAELGIIIRNPEIAEGMPRPDILLIDKKGVLTEGHPEISEVICFSGWNEERLLRVAMHAERRSSHLFAAALRRRGLAAPGNGPQMQAFEAYPGLGVTATLESRRVQVGSLAWLRQHSIEPGAAAAMKLQGKTDSLVGVAVDGALVGAIAFSDPVRPQALEEVREIEALGIQVILASGDRNATAYRVAEETGISKVYAEVDEEEKVRIIVQLQELGKKVAIVGEGFRDAPALSRADLGVAVAPSALQGAGIDLALESADLVLPRHDLRSFAAAVRLNARLRRLNRQNLLACFAWNTLLLPVAAGALYPAWRMGWSPVWAWGAAAFGLASIAVNSLRLRRFLP